MKTKLYLVLAVLASAFASQAAAGSLVDRLLDSYLTIQTALAADDLTTTQDAALGYIAAFDQASSSLNREKLQAHAETIAHANNIETARNAFAELSPQLLSLVNYMGAQSSDSVFLASCPMALDGKGASWLQSGDTLANPYFGAKMLRCGSIKSQVAGPDSTIGAHPSTADCGMDAESCEMSCCEK